MNRRIAAAVAGLLGLAALAAWAIAGPDRLGLRRPAERPPLALLTSLPLVFGERFGLEEGGSPALRRLEERYRVEPIGVADAASLNGQRLLLMAHPRAQPAEALVELDRWVREGGKLLLLADPRLDWPSERPLGDRLRPPPAFADTGLLKHWGLTLIGSAQPTPSFLSRGDHAVIYFSAGELVPTSPACGRSRARSIAACRIGNGRVVVVADADFLNAEAMESYGGSAEHQTGELVYLLELLETLCPALSRRPSQQTYPQVCQPRTSIEQIPNKP